MFYVLLCVIFIVTCLFWLFSIGKAKICKENLKTLIVIGSGGHTAEMLRLVAKFTTHYQPRLYMMADNDTTSEIKILTTESRLPLTCGVFNIIKIPRSRRVGQSYLTSVLTTSYSALRSFQYILQFSPDLVLCNGPGTCVPISIVAYFLSKLFRWRTKIIFVESICRVKTMSLSGKILLYFADFVVVQWPDLQKKYPSSLYLGRLF